MTSENNLSENEEKDFNATENIEENASHKEEIVNEQTTIPEEEHHEETHDDIEHLSLKDTLNEMEKLVNSPDAGTVAKKFNLLKDKAIHFIHDEIEDKKHEYVEAGNAVENFSFDHPSQSKLSALIGIFREKYDAYNKKQEDENKKNLEHRQNIIEKLKNLYTNSEPGVNLFKSIREIKEEWSNAGQVPKSEFRMLNNNYFHHLNQFYAMLDLNKEFLEQEYAHNLEKRQHIIARAKELENEPTVQKALNELQYLHKLWKEEAEPVAEEFREKTWEEFKEISNKIHERKIELTSAIEAEQSANLEKKTAIIEEIKKLTTPADSATHNYWQSSIKKVEDLRSEFLKLGSVSRKLSNQNWNDFKTTLRDFNSKKNEYYKSLKNSQQTNLEEKLKLIQTAKDNAASEDWEITVPLFKRLQEDWKKVGHVPRSKTNKVWDDFREACNTFFNNYREKNNASNDNWKENFKNKKALLEDLKAIGDEEGSVEKIEQIKSKWNAIGKVPREKITINTEFNKVLRDKLKLNKILWLHFYRLYLSS